MGETSTMPPALNVACRWPCRSFRSPRTKGSVLRHLRGKCNFGGYQAYYGFIAYNTSCVAMKLDECQLQLPIMCLTKTLLSQYVSCLICDDALDFANLIKAVMGKAHRSSYHHAWSNTQRFLRFFVIYFW